MFLDTEQAKKALFVYGLLLIGLGVGLDRYFDYQDHFSRVQYTYMHGIAQLLTWGLLLPVGALIPMFMRDRKWWLQAHMNIQTTASLLQIPVIYAAQKGGAGSAMYHHPHEVLGYCILGLGFFQTITGQFVTGGPKLPFTRLRLARWYHFNARCMRCMQTAHRVNGRLLIIAGFCQMPLGLSNIYKYRIGLLPVELSEVACYFIYSLLPGAAIAACLAFLVSEETAFGAAWRRLWSCCVCVGYWVDRPRIAAAEEIPPERRRSTYLLSSSRGSSLQYTYKMGDHGEDFTMVLPEEHNHSGGALDALQLGSLASTQERLLPPESKAEWQSWH